MWLEDLLDFWFPEDRGLSDAAEAAKSGSTSKTVERVKYIADATPLRGSEGAIKPDSVAAHTSASSLSPLPDIPEFYLRHIPCEPCPSAVEEAERVVRR